MIKDSISVVQEQTHPYFDWGKSNFSGLTANTDTISSAKQITESFLPTGGVSISEIPMVGIREDWLTYLLLGLLLGIALIWNFMPERLLSIFNFPSNSSSKRLKDSGYNSPGFLISFYLFTNYLFTFSLFIFLFIKYVLPASQNVYSNQLLYVYIPVLIFTFYLFRLIFIRINGFLFKTNSISKQQQLIYANVDNLMGIILIPVIFLVMYSKVNAFIYLGVFIVLIVHLFRWLQTFILGKTVSGFSVLHLFMYLCTLEIIPLLLLVKLLESGMI